MRYLPAALIVLTLLTTGCLEPPLDDAGEDAALEANDAAMESGDSEDTAADTVAEEDAAAEAGDAVSDSEDTSDTDTMAVESAAPLPPAAARAEMPESGYLVEEIADGLYWLTEGAYQVMFLVTGEGVIVVDAPPSIGERILTAIADVTDEPITHVVYSHSHADHIAAAGIYPEDAEYIAHVDTAAQLERVGDPERAAPYGLFVGGGDVPMPTQTFDDSYTLSVGTQTLQLDYPGPNHEAGNIFVYAPDQKVLMVVDVFFPGWVPFKNLALAEDVPGFVAVHDLALEYDFDVLVAGHLDRLGTREDVETQRAYVQDVHDSAAAALQSVDFGAIAAETGVENAWLLFGSYFDAVAEDCAARVEAEWIDQLGGADIFTVDHCFKVMESLRID